MQILRRFPHSVPSRCSRLLRDRSTWICRSSFSSRCCRSRTSTYSSRRHPRFDHCSRSSFSSRSCRPTPSSQRYVRHLSKDDHRNSHEVHRLSRLGLLRNLLFLLFDNFRSPSRTQFRFDPPPSRLEMAPSNQLDSSTPPRSMRRLSNLSDSRSSIQVHPLELPRFRSLSKL